MSQQIESRNRSTAPDRIDAHHHLWRYTPEEYSWIQDGMEAIRRDFLVADLKDAVRQSSIGGVVTVQARQSLAETDWLLEVAARNELVRAVVGWVPLAERGVGSMIERYAANPKLKAVRHIIQDEPDDSYILRDDFNEGIRALRQFGLRYDILVFERQLPQTIEFADRHPNQVFIVDHMAKPRIREHVLSPWREHMRELAKRENVYCKLSGLVTEADWKGWTEKDLQPYLDVVLEGFGPKRLMFGSDWPVCLLACAYGQWVQVVERATAALSASEKQSIWADTAKAAYAL